MAGEREPKFYNELKQLNEDLIGYLQEVQKKSPYFDFTLTLEDYIGQMKELLQQYPEKSGRFAPPRSSSTATTAITSAPTPAQQPPTFSFSASLNSQQPAALSNSATSTTASSLPSFSSAPNSLASSVTSTQTTTTTSTTTSPFAPINASFSTAQPFLFGSAVSNLSNPISNTSAAPPPATSTGSTSFFSFSLPPKKVDEENKLGSLANDTLSGNANATTVEDDAPPPEPNVDKYEETDVKYSARCKLYSKHGSSLDLLGFGMLYVKPFDVPSKLQVIFRQDPDLRRVLLNEIITPNIPVKILPKAVQMIFPNSSGESKFFIAKVKGETEANELYGMLNMKK